MSELSSEQLDQLTVWQNMQAAQRSLHHARLAIRGREIMPEANVARHWLLITGVYSLLEQSLKFLCHLQDPTYDLETMRKEDKHNLHAVYDRLELPDKKQDVLKPILRRYFDEYASFANIAELNGLDQYLQEKGGGRRYQNWRYFLLEQDLDKLDQGQRHPFYADLMLEIINGVLAIIGSYIHEQPAEHGLNDSVSYRLVVCP